MSIECWIMSEVEVQLGNCCVLPRCTLFCPLLLKALAPAGLRSHDTGGHVGHFAGLHPRLYSTAKWKTFKIEQFAVSTFILFHGRKNLKTGSVNVCDEIHASFCLLFLFQGCT